MYEAFAKYVRGEVPFLPWCEVPLQAETSTISQDLVAINQAGFLTINSQVHAPSAFSAAYATPACVGAWARGRDAESVCMA